MIKVKRSFLEKLTGSSRIDEVDEEFEVPSRPLARIYEEEEDEPEMIINNSSNNRRTMPQEENNISINDESEGQLTIDVYQTDNDIVIKSTIAGVKPEDLDVTINSDMVSIRGERKNEEMVNEENYYYQECYWGSFSRSVILPIDVLAEKAEASMKNGILTIRLPKADNTKTKKIQVRGF
jgi:HSP20 family protein